MWEKENTLRLLEENETTEAAAEHMLHNDVYGGIHAVRKIAAQYEMTKTLSGNRTKGNRDERGEEEGGQRHVSRELLFRIASHGFQIERELIQQMFEEGRLSRETARNMRGNISMLEAKLYEE